MLAAEAAQQKSPVVGHVSDDRARLVICYRLPFTLEHCRVQYHHIVMEQNWHFFSYCVVEITVARPVIVAEPEWTHRALQILRKVKDLTRQQA